MAMCCYIDLRGNQVNPNYCTNWQFVAYQRITCSKLTTETLKTSSDIVHGEIYDTRGTWIALVVCTYWLPWTSPNYFDLYFEQVFTCWVPIARVALKIKEVQISRYTRLATNKQYVFRMTKFLVFYANIS